MRLLTIHNFIFVSFCLFFSLNSILGKVARGVQARTMATEAQLKLRILGTQNISKITKSMKMVSAAKLRGDQTRLAAAIPFAVSVIILIHSINTVFFFFPILNANVTFLNFNIPYLNEKF